MVLKKQMEKYEKDLKFRKKKKKTAVGSGGPFSARNPPQAVGLRRQDGGNRLWRGWKWSNDNGAI